VRVRNIREGNAMIIISGVAESGERFSCFKAKVSALLLFLCVILSECIVD